MFEKSNSLIITLILNSILIITLILNQNENVKDSTINPNSSSTTNPLETLTWFCFISQLVLLLIKIKTNDF